MAKLGERTIWIDCDVLDADGGTRTASVTGAYVALVDCVESACARRARFRGRVVREAVAAVSAGIVDGKPTLDLSYVEDSAAEADMNIVMTAGGRFVEVQGTGEKRPFTRAELDSVLNLGRKGILKLIRFQREALSRK